MECDCLPGKSFLLHAGSDLLRQGTDDWNAVSIIIVSVNVRRQSALIGDTLGLLSLRDYRGPTNAVRAVIDVGAALLAQYGLEDRQV